MPFPRRDEQQRISGPPGAPGTADAVHIGLGIVRDVVVEHMRDAFHIKAPGGNVGGHQDVDTTVLERGDRTFALNLGDVAVDGGCGKPSGTQLFSHFLGGLLGPHEHDHCLELLDLKHPGQRVHLARPGDLDVALSDVLGGGCLGLDLDFDGVVEVLRGDLSDRRGHGCREQRNLFVLRGVSEDPLHVLGKTHLQHLVGLVKHQIVQMLKIQRAALEVIDDTARRADDDVRAASQPGQLHRVGLAAVDRQHGDLRQVRAVTTERLGDLQSKFASGRQHQRLSVLTRGVDPGQDRDGEGSGLPGAGLGQADHVGTGHQGWDGGRLDR